MACVFVHVCLSVRVPSWYYVNVVGIGQRQAELTYHRTAVVECTRTIGTGLHAPSVSFLNSERGYGYTSSQTRAKSRPALEYVRSPTLTSGSELILFDHRPGHLAMRWLSPFESLALQAMDLSLCFSADVLDGLSMMFTTNELYLMSGQAFHSTSAAVEVFAVLASSDP